MMITLGEKIFLKNFEILDQAELLIAKKLIGSYIRKACEEAHCKQIELKLEKNEEYTIKVQAKFDDGSTIETNACAKNIFVTIDLAMKSLLTKIGI